MKVPGRPPRRRRPGTAETLLVLLVVTLGVQIAVPNARRLRAEAEAAQLAEAVERLGEAAGGYRAEHGVWPPAWIGGRAPDSLQPYLPAGFSRAVRGHTLSWEHWELPDGLPPNREAGALVGVSVEPVGPDVGAALSRRLAPYAYYVLGERYTFIMAGI